MRLTETRNLSLVFLFSSFSFSKLRPYFLSKLIPPICQPLSLNPEAWHSFGYPLAFEISIFSVPYALFSKSRKLFRSVTSKLRTFFLTLIFLQNPCGIFLKKKKKKWNTSYPHYYIWNSFTWSVHTLLFIGVIKALKTQSWAITSNQLRQWFFPLLFHFYVSFTFCTSYQFTLLTLSSFLKISFLLVSTTGKIWDNIYENKCLLCLPASQLSWHGLEFLLVHLDFVIHI